MLECLIGNVMRTSSERHRRHGTCTNRDGSAQHHLFGSSEDWTRDVFSTFLYFFWLF